MVVAVGACFFCCCLSSEGNGLRDGVDGVGEAVDVASSVEGDGGSGDSEVVGGAWEGNAEQRYD